MLIPRHLAGQAQEVGGFFDRPLGELGRHLGIERPRPFDQAAGGALMVAETLVQRAQLLEEGGGRAERRDLLRPGRTERAAERPRRRSGRAADLQQENVPAEPDVAARLLDLGHGVAQLVENEARRRAVQQKLEHFTGIASKSTDISATTATSPRPSAVMANALPSRGEIVNALKRGIKAAE